MRIWNRSNFAGYPPGISNGLASSCAVCDKFPDFDYQVTNEFWQDVVPLSLRPSVICLPCLTKMADKLNKDPHEHLREVQIFNGQSTVVLAPAFVVRGVDADREAGR